MTTQQMQQAYWQRLRQQQVYNAYLEKKKRETLQMNTPEVVEVKQESPVQTEEVKVFEEVDSQVDEFAQEIQVQEETKDLESQENPKTTENINYKEYLDDNI